MARRGSLWDANHQNQNQALDRLSPAPASTSSSRSLRPMDDASKFGQSFAPSTSYLSTHGHGHGHGPARRHSVMPMTTDPSATTASFGTSFHGAAEQRSRRTHDTHDSGHQRRRRRHRHRHDDEGLHFSDDEHVLPGHGGSRYSNDESDGSMADEASDLSSDDSDEEPALHGRRHTTAGRHTRTGRSTNTADDFSSSYSRAIPIATPSRRDSYLEDQALSARGDRLGGYFPFHEDPNLRIQRSHPFHSASAKARKQSITLAQSAASQSIPHHHQDHSPNSRRSLAVPRPDRHGSISAAALARRESALGTTPSRLDISSSVSHYGTTPAPPLSSSRLSPASPAIAWRTIRGFDTSKTDASPGFSSMSAFQPPEKNSDGSAPSRYRAEYDDLDPLDPIPEPRPRPRTQPPPSSSRARAPPPMPFHYTQHNHDDVDPLAQSPPLGKYHPSVYENRHKLASRSSSGETPDILFISSDEDEDPIPPMRSVKHQASLDPTGPGAFNRSHSMGLTEPTMRSVSATHGSGYDASPMTYQNQAYSLPSAVKRLGAGPASPRLDPKGSPGPVTPMDLETSGTLYGSGSGMAGSNPYFERSRGGGKEHPLRY